MTDKPAHMFIRLRDGNTTHYELTGPEGAPLVVLIHGISIPMYSWDNLAPRLVQSGYRVLRYDVYGRGESAYPKADYDRNLLMSQLTNLLDALVGEREKINLVGFSFGGAMAALFTSRYAPHVARVALVSPFARLTPEADKRPTLRLPVVGDLIMRLKMREALRLRAAKLLAAAGLPGECKHQFDHQAARSEFCRAFLSLMRGNGLDPYGAALEAVAASGVPTALAWGTADEDINAASNAYTRERLKPQHYLELPGVGHGGILHPDSGLLPFLLEFLAVPLPEPEPVPEPQFERREERREEGGEERRGERV